MAVDLRGGERDLDIWVRKKAEEIFVSLLGRKRQKKVQSGALCCLHLDLLLDPPISEISISVVEAQNCGRGASDWLRRTS